MMEMKWFVVACLLMCLVRFGDAGALKCTPASIDPACLDKETLDIPAPEADLLEAECLVGSKWESNCHSCRCTKAGVAECSYLDSCDNNKAELEPIHCKPNTTFKRDCNTCVCLDSGLGLCTLRICKHSPVPTKSSLAAGRECAPETSWKSQCNECQCTQDGYAACTEKPCPGQEAGPLMRCAPETAWKNECNTCWCTADGRAMCTRMGCITGVTMHFEDGDEMTVNKNLSTDKTPVKIDLDYFDSHNIVKRSVCKPNENFQHDCNTCKCSSNGLTYRCTQNECMDKEDGVVDKEVEVFMENEGVDHIERHSVCKPAGIFYIGCNTCHCNFDGTDYSCTNKPCPLPEDVELFHELKGMKSAANHKNNSIVCVANRMFIRDCNTCWCNEDGTGFFCTRKVCVPELPDDVASDEEKPEELRVIKRECRPDEVFEIDCNMCRCNPDGKSFSCTRRACLSEPAVEQVRLDNYVKNASLSRKVRGLPPALLKTCQPNQNFRMDCNQCLCDKLGEDFSCTRIDCDALNKNNNGGTRKKREVAQQAITQCEPGALFEQDCNLCRCTSDGHHASCTLKMCKKEKPEENEKEDLNENVAEGDPNFRCNPGEQFKRGCNDCTCSADGKSVFCTLRFCDKDLAPKL